MVKEFLEKKARKYIAIIMAVIVLIVFLIVGIMIVPKVREMLKPEPEIVTQTSLEQVLNVSDLSTSSVVYNGVAQVNNPEKSDEIKYYVSYEARVDVGLDFEKIQYFIDKEAGTVKVVLPKLYITNTNVAIESLDYIFLDRKADASTVSEEAYKACIQDATEEAGREGAIFELGKKNAENVAEALLKPFLEQLEIQYTFTIEWGE